MFPSNRRAVTGRKAIAGAVAEWLGPGRVARSAKISGTPIVGQRGAGDPETRSSHVVVVSADLDVVLVNKGPKPSYRATAVLSDGLDPAHPQILMPTALFITVAVDDDLLHGEDLPAESSTFDRFLDLLRVPDLLAARFDGGPGDIVIGTAPGERATGDDAKEMLARWRGRKYALIGKPHVVEQLDWVYAMATVKLARKTGKPAPIHVLLVGYRVCKGSCVGTEMTPHVVALHFGQGF